MMIEEQYRPKETDNVSRDGYSWLHERNTAAEVFSLSERVADSVRAAILAGQFEPGERLNEPQLVDALAISRNTLREAFRVLAEERLVEHRFNRGVFVRIPSPDDVRDLYAARRVVECTPLRADAPRHDSSGLSAALTEAQKAHDAGDAVALGAADINFHVAVTQLNASTHLDRLLRPMWYEMRLVFFLAGDARGFHDRYVDRNAEILDRYDAGDPADGLMHSYLDDAERDLLSALSR